MSQAKRMLEQNGSVWTIGERNPYLGRIVECRWLKPWGKKPEGHIVRGKLDKTFCVGGRTLLAEIHEETLAGNYRRHNVPWSKNYLAVRILPENS